MDNIIGFDARRSLGAFDKEPNVGTLVINTINGPVILERASFDGVAIETDVRGEKNLCAESDDMRIIRVPLANVRFWEFQ